MRRAAFAMLLAAAAALAQPKAPVTQAPPAISGPSPKDLKYPPARGVQVPELTASVLPNGIKLFLQEDHELPVISGSLLIRTGRLLDPPERIGLAQITGITLRSGGTALKTGEQLDALLEDLGASVETGVGESRGTVNFFVPKENADRL